jgi:hypothetical protein
MLLTQPVEEEQDIRKERTKISLAEHIRLPLKQVIGKSTFDS